MLSAGNVNRFLASPSPGSLPVVAPLDSGGFCPAASLPPTKAPSCSPSSVIILDPQSAHCNCSCISPCSKAPSDPPQPPPDPLICTSTPSPPRLPSQVKRAERSSPSSLTAVAPPSPRLLTTNTRQAMTPTTIPSHPRRPATPSRGSITHQHPIPASVSLVLLSQSNSSPSHPSLLPKTPALAL